MAYELQAILGTKQSLQEWCKKYKHATLIPLPQTLQLIPITMNLYNEVNQNNDKSPAIEGFLFLDESIASVLENLSESTSIAYVEAEFFGGAGEQNVILWTNGEVVFTEHGINAINHTLKKLGVTKGSYQDEFDAVDLGRKRFTTDWIEK